MNNQSFFTPVLKTLNLSRKEQNEWAKKAREIGFETSKYFFFTDGDEAGKAKAKAECEAYIKEWADKIGIGASASEGFFL